MCREFKDRRRMRRKQLLSITVVEAEFWAAIDPWPLRVSMTDDLI
jgi:hypothetical protein